MKFFALFLRFSAVTGVLWVALSVTAFSQTTKLKSTAAKSTAIKTQPGTKKPKPAAAKSTTSTKPKTATPKPKTTATKPKTPKPKPVEEPKPDEKTEWDKTIAVSNASERISAVRKFLSTFPASERQNEGLSLIVTAATEIGNASLSAGELQKAAEYFKVAANDAPVPVPDQLFNGALAKIPLNLYFRGARTEAFEIASILEQKAAANADQLLNIATFYMSVENGAEARRVADAAIKIAPTSSAAYQTLGLASRIDFRLDESAAAYQKAVELDPDSLSARRGLAEMKRSTGKADEALTLYREILAKDATNVPSQTGLVLALFDNGKVTEAEAEMAKSLEANPGNVILLAGAAYWYAVNKNGDKAVSAAQQAITSDPRFIWSHIALARGYLSQNNAAAAEKTLLAARRYGNFPTLEYEIASARIASGFYREASEELVKSFSVKDGIVHTNLGGRVSRESKDFTELVGFERRASIFAPTAADSPENAAKLTALLEIKQQIDTAKPSDETIARAIDDFVRGDDKMRVHRQLFAATQLLEKRILLPKVLELTKAAVSGVDTGLEIAAPSAAVMASELYESRSIAITKGEYINLPEVPRQTLSAIMRGRIEEIAGWALYQTDANDDAIVRLKRAVGVLPGDSAWWRSSTWRLASALAKAGKDSEALDWYIKSYKGATPNAFSYAVIEGLYKKVNGTTDGLELKIGAKPVMATTSEALAQKVEPTATPEIRAEASPSESPKPSETPAPSTTPAVAAEERKPTATPEEAKTTPTPEEAKATPTPEVSPVPSVVPISTPLPSPTIVEESKAEPTPIPETRKPTAEPTPTESPSSTPEEPKSSPSPTPKAKPTEPLDTAKPVIAAKELFPPVIISITRPSTTPTATTPEPTPTPQTPPTEKKPTEESPKTPSETTVAEGRPRVVTTSEPIVTKPCKLTVSEETVTLQSGGGDLAVIVGRTDDVEDLDGLTAVSTSPEQVSVRREQIAGVKARALFVLRPGERTGVFQVLFQLPCGKKEIVVRIR